MKFKFSRKYLCIPYAVFLILFVVIPIVLVIYYAFSDANGYLSIDALVKFFTSTTKLNVLIVSIFVAFQTTIICLIIGFPLALLLANKRFNKNVVLVMLFVMPMWINFVLRTGATRDLLSWMDINGGNYPYLATMIGMVYNYLPFTILPLYTTMLKIDKSQLEAANDLGASPINVFFKALVPQTIPGIVSACTMVFMPTMSSYVISDVLSEGKITLFGNSIYLNFANSQWNDGSFMALIMLIIVGITMFLTRNVNKDDVMATGGNLW
ncbi:MAG: ABC transporter permease [Bacilli bacterium]|jgi:spermidine/putrescine transport system permease protein